MEYNDKFYGKIEDVGENFKKIAGFDELIDMLKNRGCEVGLNSRGNILFVSPNGRYWSITEGWIRCWAQNRHPGRTYRRYMGRSRGGDSDKQYVAFYNVPNCHNFLSNGFYPLIGAIRRAEEVHHILSGEFQSKAAYEKTNEDFGKIPSDAKKSEPATKKIEAEELVEKIGEGLSQIMIGSLLKNDEKVLEGLQKMCLPILDVIVEPVSSASEREAVKKNIVDVVVALCGSLG
jgi:hypothetical protein